MKRLVMCMMATGLFTAPACSPMAEGLCESKVSCGIATSTESCLDDLRTQRDAAAGCTDAFYNLLSCESDNEYSCGDFNAWVASTCSVEKCELDLCRTAGPNAPFNPCTGDKFDPTGEWSVLMSPTSQNCPMGGWRAELYVVKSNGQYIIKTHAYPNTTGSVEVSHDGAVMHVMSGGMYADGLAIYTVDITATAQTPDGQSSATLSGAGTITQGACADAVMVSGQLYYGTQWME